MVAHTIRGDYLEDMARKNVWSILGSEDEKIVKAVARLYGFLETLEEYSLKDDLAPFVEDGARFPDRQAEGYSLHGLRTSNYAAEGQEHRWCLTNVGDGARYGIVMDTPTGVGLFYKGAPNGFFGVMPENSDTLLIHQIQGVTGAKVDAEGKIVGKLNPWGLEPLQWGRFLFDRTRKIAERLGFSRIGVQSGRNSISLKLDGGDVHGITEAQAVRIHDDFADAEGLIQGRNGNWYAEVR